MLYLGLSGFLEIVPEEQRTVGSVMLQFILNRYVQVHEQQNSSLPFAQRNSRD